MTKNFGNRLGSSARAVLFSMLIVTVAAFGFVAKARGLGKGVPRLAVDSRVMIGTVFQGDKVNHRFEIRNTGDRDLVLSDEIEACACTTTRVSARRIKPGGVSSIDATIDTGILPAGATFQTIGIGTNDPAKAKLVLSFEGYVTGEIELSAPMVDFGLIDGADEILAERSLIISVSPTARPLAIKSVDAGLKAMLLPVSGRSDQIRLVTTLDRQTHRRVISANVFLSTGSKSRPQVDIPVRGYMTQ